MSSPYRDTARLQAGRTLHGYPYIHWETLLEGHSAIVRAQLKLEAERKRMRLELGFVVVLVPLLVMTWAFRVPSREPSETVLFGVLVTLVSTFGVVAAVIPLLKNRAQQRALCQRVEASAEVVSTRVLPQPSHGDSLPTSLVEVDVRLYPPESVPDGEPFDLRVQCWCTLMPQVGQSFSVLFDPKTPTEIEW